MTINVLLQLSTTVFKCQYDKDIFYQELNKVHGIEKVISKNNDLIISVSQLEKSKTLKDLRLLCDIWHVAIYL